MREEPVYLKKPINQELEDLRKDFNFSRSKIIEIAIDSFVHSYRSAPPIRKFVKVMSFSESERRDAIRRGDTIAKEISNSLLVSDPENILEEVRKSHWKE